MNKTIPLIENTAIARQIMVIRGKQVLLDRDLAEMYGVETKVFNQAVKRNSKRFPEAFMFQLSKEEFDIWRSQFVTSKADKKGLRYAPYAFTEQGVAMLPAVLHSAKAVKISIEIMNAFVYMRHYLVANRDILDDDNAILKMQVLQNTNDISVLKADYQKVMENFIDPTTYKHFLIFNGHKLEADAAYTQIYGMASDHIQRPEGEGKADR